MKLFSSLGIATIVGSPIVEKPSPPSKTGFAAALGNFLSGIKGYFKNTKLSTLAMEAAVVFVALAVIIIFVRVKARNAPKKRGRKALPRKHGAMARIKNKGNIYK